MFISKIGAALASFFIFNFAAAQAPTGPRPSDVAHAADAQADASVERAGDSGGPSGEANEEGDDAAEPTRVVVGIYVNQIKSVSLKDHDFQVDFWVWFRYSGEGVDPLSSFEIVGGNIDSKESEVRENLNETTKYAAARVIATVKQFFDVSKFPLDNHVLRLVIEDTEHEKHELVFVADEPNSKIDPGVVVPGWNVRAQRPALLEHSYRTNYGDITLPTNSESTYSRFEFRIELRRSGLGYAFKLFWSVYLATLIGLLAFFIKPTDLDPRFGLGVGAIFAAMASSYVISSVLPETDRMTTADKVNMLAIAYIFLSIVGSTVSLKLFSMGREQTSNRFDLVLVTFLLASYAAANVYVLL